MVLINAEHAFTRSGKNIPLLILEVLLLTEVGYTSSSKKISDQAVLNAILLPPFLVDAVVLEVQAQESELRKTYIAKILEQGS